MSRPDDMEPAILRTFQKWKADFHNEQLTLWDYLSFRADPELTAIFTKMFWPDFVEIDDCVLLAERYVKTNFEQWKAKFPKDKQKIEALINHIHVYELFPSRGNEIDLKIYEHIGRTLMMCWDCALRKRYPSRVFTFTYATEPEDYGPTLTFFQRSEERK